MLRLRDQILYTLLRLTRKSRIMNVITLITSTIKDYIYNILTISLVLVQVIFLKPDFLSDAGMELTCAQMKAENM